VRTLNGEPATADHGHTGWPARASDMLHRVSKGLPAYCPTDPVSINQKPYRDFAATRGPGGT